MEEHYIKDVGKITYVYGVNLEEHKTVIEKQQKRIAELEQELAELKEKAIVPRFKVGQEVWHLITGEQPTKDIVARNDLFIYELGISKFGIYEEYLCETEEEAQEKLKEIQGNE